MKKFNVKVLSMAIAAAVVSSAAGAAERDLGSIPEKAQNAMAFQTVFGENTKFDEDTGKFTFDKDSSALLLKTMELEQAVNGFAAGSNFVATNEDGSKTVREATQADVEADGFGGLGLKEVVAAHDEALGNLTETVNDNSEALVKTAEVVNAISADVNANKAALEEQKEANEGFNNAIASLDEDISALKKVGLAAADALEVNRQDIDANKAAIDKKADKADFEELAKYTADMGKKVNDIGDEVTALSDATSAAITRHDKDIVDLAQAGLKATEALEANRQDIDANKAAIAENTASLKEQEKANEGFNNAIASLDEDISTLKKVGLAAADALEVNRQDIDANKAAIDKKADKADIETAKNAAVEAEKSAKSAQGSVEVAQKSAETAESHAKAAKTSADAANNVASAAQTAAAQAQDAVKANATQVAANKADIAKNSARIDNLDKNVANLRKETRQGLAAQAALSGLFQPYSVGKFNVTAALGGFKSDTAVAVGAGYRFNENFAAKAGLAVGTSSGGSASYNVGVNYEW